MWIKKEKHRQELSVLLYSAHDSAQTFVNNTFYLTTMQNAELYCAVNTVFFLSVFCITRLNGAISADFFFFFLSVLLKEKKKHTALVWRV